MPDEKQIKVTKEMIEKVLGFSIDPKNWEDSADGEEKTKESLLLLLQGLENLAKYVLQLKKQG